MEEFWRSIFFVEYAEYPSICLECLEKFGKEKLLYLEGVGIRYLKKFSHNQNI